MFGMYLKSVAYEYDAAIIIIKFIWHMFASDFAILLYGNSIQAAH